jgi:uncharacterized protein (DUF697 family)
MAEIDANAEQARKIVRNHSLGSAPVGLVPVPVVDLGILALIQLRMVKQLAELYKVEYSKQRAGAIIASLVGMGAAVAVGSLLKMLPGVGMAVGAVSGFALPAASTYALGHVFIEHFSSGGTFVTFDMERAKKLYEEKLAEGKRQAEASYSNVKP